MLAKHHMNSLPHRHLTTLRLDIDLTAIGIGEQVDGAPSYQMYEIIR